MAKVLLVLLLILIGAVYVTAYYILPAEKEAPATELSTAALLPSSWSQSDGAPVCSVFFPHIARQGLPEAAVQEREAPLLNENQLREDIYHLPDRTDGFKTVFFFGTQDNYDETLSWAQGMLNTGIWYAIVAVIVMVTLPFRLKRLPGPRKISALLFVILWLFIWIGGTAVAFRSGITESAEQEKEFQNLMELYRNDQYRVAEGVVEVLHEQPYGGHDKGDIIRIGEDELKIDYYTSTFGYKKTISHCGALVDGVYARVYYTLVKGNFPYVAILRVDVLDDGQPNCRQPSAGWAK